ncbi:methyl-accepting chemotaxis protein [Desulfovibrio sp. OttesenSCG-928-G15]|nr:methyl-accepting chemotaxis protein [Desulfovibrio sp. OttesenSCG-928-G15]
MRLSIFAKVAVLLIVSIAVVVVPLSYTVIDTIDGVLRKEAEEGLHLKATAVEKQLSGMHDSVESVLWQAVRRSDLIEATVNNDITALKSIAKDMDERSSIDFVTVTDGEGNVLLRGHSDKKGDSIARVDCVKKSLAGAPITIGIAPGKEVAFSVRGGAPMVKDGKIVGVLSVGVRLDSSALADEMKSQLGTELTFFKDKLRVATSLKDKDGKPMVGTELSNEAVESNVLQGGRAFQNNSAMIGGIEYSVLYTPLRDVEEKIVGMFFLGTPTTTLALIKSSIINRTLAIAGGLSLLMGLIGVFVARRVITAPLARVTNVIKDLVDDKAELSYRFDTSSRDEVAHLAHQVNRLTGKVEAMLCNIEGYKNLMNAIPEPVFAVDDNYKVSLVNERVCKLSGVTDPTVLYGKHINDILKTTIYGSDKCPLKDVMKSRTRSVSEVFPLYIDGKERLIRGLSDVIKDCHGNDAGFFQVASDVTDMVEQERTLANQMERISEVNTKVTGIAAQVNTSANTIQHQTNSIQGAAAQQSKLMGETQRAIQQMNETVMDIARNAGDASASAGESQHRAAEGEKIVHEAMEAIDSVRNLASALHASLSQLGVHAESIGQVMNVISDIADQTNLLALNAAIEAARAGEAGRGFAVVADEVRKLAEKSMGATQEVRKATQDIQQGADDNISNMDKVSQAVENATELSKRSGEVLGQIVGLVSQTTAQITSIAAAAEEQSASSEEIARSVNQVTDISEKTVRETTESAQAVNELATLARELHVTVS